VGARACGGGGGRVRKDDGLVANSDGYKVPGGFFGVGE
jgi:hypothetical protein